MLPQDKDKLGEQLSAYLDGELGESEAADVERRIAADPQVREMLESLRRTVETVRSLPRRSAPDDLLDDLTTSLERGQFPDGIPGQDRPVRGNRRLAWGLLAGAAVVIFAVGGGFWAFTHLSDSTHRTERQLALGEKKAVPSSQVEAEEETYRIRGLRDEQAPTSPTRRAKKTKPVEAAGGKAFEAKLKAKPDAAPVFADAVLAESAPPYDPNDPIETKLGYGIKRKEVLAHSFANEHLNLNVSFADARDRDAARNEINAFLLSNAVEPLRDAVVKDAEPVSPALNFFVEGQAPRNFVASTEDRRFLVRLPAPKLVAMVQRVAASPGRRLELEVGRIVAASDAGRVDQMLRESFAKQFERRAERAEDQLAEATKGAGASETNRGSTHGRAMPPSVLKEISATTSKSKDKSTDSKHEPDSRTRKSPQKREPEAAVDAEEPAVATTNSLGRDEERLEPDAAEEVITVVINLCVQPTQVEGDTPSTQSVTTQPTTSQPATTKP